MSTPTVHVRREAFFSMILSSAEIFRRECLGIVFGYLPSQSRNHFLVTNALDIKGVKLRLNTKVHQSKKSEQALKGIFRQGESVFRPIGSFHSHAEWGNTKGLAELDEEDIKDMHSERETLNFIIAIAGRKKGSAPWEIQADGSIKGSLYKFNFHIAAFILVDDEDNKKIPFKLKIVAPEALKALNRVHGYS